MRTALVCHRGAPIHEEGIARWLAAGSELAGIVVLAEPPRTTWRRVRRELRRSGTLGFLDVLAFRAYYRAFGAPRDARWMAEQLERLRRAYPAVPASVPVLHTSSVNSPETERFLAECRPDIVVALCKSLLQPRIFRIPTNGTFVFHPGICPEYRNAHGCFWALAQGDIERVGMTLLRIDEGVDTGPIFQYCTYRYDEVGESHIIIQQRVVLENLDALMASLRAIHRGDAKSIDTTGRRSSTWGQPRLTSYLRWKRAARRRANAARRA